MDKPILVNYDEGIEMAKGFDEGVSGAFAGQVGEWFVWGGGCNFPSFAPERKLFYDALYATRPSGEGQWETIYLGALGSPCGYGASLLSDDGSQLYLIGGTDGAIARKEIYRIELKDGQPVLEPLETKLPFGWYEGGAALVGDQLYLAGGWRGDEGGNSPLLSLARVSLSTGEVTEWLPLPEGARIQPVLWASHGYLYLYGGFRPAGGGEPPYMHGKGYRVDLIEAQPTWEEVADTPVVTIGGEPRQLLFVGSTVAHDPVSGETYLAGGVDWQIFETAVQREHREALARASSDTKPEELAQFDEARKAYLTQSPEAYRFMPALLRFVPEHNGWEVVTEDSAFATAGAVLSSKGGTLYLVGGERKPRLRTPDIWLMKSNHK